MAGRGVEGLLCRRGDRGAVRGAVRGGAWKRGALLGQGVLRLRSADCGERLVGRLTERVEEIWVVNDVGRGTGGALALVAG